MPFDPDFTRARYDHVGKGEWDRWDASPAARLQEAVIHAHLTRTVTAGDRVLDAGCGAGRFTAFVLGLGAEVTALDLSPRQIELCRAHAPGAAEHVVGSILDLSRFDDDTFDATLCLGGPLSYTFDRAPDALAELVRVTRPGGRVLVTVMSLHGSLHAFLPGVLEMPLEFNRDVTRTGEQARGPDDGHECRLFRASEARALLEGAGLVDVGVASIGFLAEAHAHVDLPDPGTLAWDWLVETELAASAENPGAGPHVVAWGSAS